jgi:hypothetical protein
MRIGPSLTVREKKGKLDGTVLRHRLTELAVPVNSFPGISWAVHWVFSLFVRRRGSLTELFSDIALLSLQFL